MKSVWIYDFYAMVFTTSSIYVITLLSLKYQFVQVQLEIEECLNRKLYHNLKELFESHILIERETFLMNKEMRHYIYIMYKVIKPCFNVLVYISHASDSIPIMKQVTTSTVVFLALMLFTINYQCASVTGAAHRPQSTLYKTVLSRNHNIPLKIRLKIMRFIERLSGPEIGFYCYDLFPMTSYKFADYVLDSIASYFLILTALQTNNFI